MINTVPTKPYDDQKPGTSGLRKKVPRLPAAELCRELHPVDLRLPGELRRQDAGDRRRRPLLQPRGHPDRDPQMAAANGFGRVLVGQGGILSTPAASNVIRKYKRLRRHHPLGQPQSRRPARGLRHQVQYRQWRPGAREDHRGDLRTHARRSTSYKIADVARPRSRHGSAPQTLGDMTVEVIDPVADYAALMETLFDFAAIRAMFARRLPHALRRHARRHRPLCARDPRGPPRRARRAPSATARRCPISAATTPTPTSSTPRSSTTR